MAGTLSDANNTEVDIDLTAIAVIATANYLFSVSKEKYLTTVAGTTYYLNILTKTSGDTITFTAGAKIGNTIIEIERIG